MFNVYSILLHCTFKMMQNLDNPRISRQRTAAAL